MQSLFNTINNVIAMEQKKSAINRHNGVAQKTNHCYGTKSFARVSRELVLYCICYHQP